MALAREHLVMKHVLLVVGLLTSGCVVTLSDGARARGAIDLECPSGQVDAYQTSSGFFYARGCGRVAKYGCFWSASKPVCLRDGPVSDAGDGGAR